MNLYGLTAIVSLELKFRLSAVLLALPFSVLADDLFIHPHRGSQMTNRPKPVSPQYTYRERENAGASVLLWLSGLEPLTQYHLGKYELHVMPVKVTVAVLLVLFGVFELLPMV